MWVVIAATEEENTQRGLSLMRQVLKSKKITSPPVIHEFLEFHTNFDLFIISCPLPIVHETHETFIFKVLGANNLVLSKLGPGQLVPICHFLSANSWAPGPTVRGPLVRGPTVRGPTVRGPICLEPTV